MPKTIYLANPYGFSTQQKAVLLPPIIAALESLGLEVWEPFARNNQVDFQQAGWAYRVGQQDYADVVDADAIFGMDVDDYNIGSRRAFEKAGFSEHSSGAHSVEGQEQAYRDFVIRRSDIT